MSNNINGRHVPRIGKGEPIRASWLNRLVDVVNNAIGTARLSGVRRKNSRTVESYNSVLPFAVSVSVEPESQDDGSVLHKGIITPENGGSIYFGWEGSAESIFEQELRFRVGVGEPFVIPDLSSEMKKSESGTLTYWASVRVNANTDTVQNFDATAFFNILMGLVSRDQGGSTRNYLVEVLDDETHRLLSSVIPESSPDMSWGVFETCIDCARIVFARSYYPDGTEYYTVTLEQYLRSDFRAPLLCIPEDFDSEDYNGE